MMQIYNLYRFVRDALLEVLTQVLNPKPYTLNPTPSTLNPQPLCML